MTDFRNNHYVPRWYQERFLSSDGRERKFYYLDLRPDRVLWSGRVHYREAIRRLGTKNCFMQRDLYTTRFGGWRSVDIERQFFGHIDRCGRQAVEYFANFRHPSVDHDAFRDMMLYLSLQKLRTPKGLAQLAEMVQLSDHNAVLQAMERLQQIYCATWTECVWSIADASRSSVRFILSDHPITIYNHGCFPESTYCRGHRDPDIRMTGSHTIFPLSPDKVLILTNLSWVRNPYTNPLLLRPNPTFFRSTMFNFQAIQTERFLSETEVQEINLVIKERAFRYVAAAEREWLFPEEALPHAKWDRLGGGYLLIPDPRGVDYTKGMMVGYGNERSEMWDEYGRRPGQPGFSGSSGPGEDWDTFRAFQGEFARVFGPRRRGRRSWVGCLEPEEDSPQLHASYLRQEANKPRDSVAYRSSRRRRKR
jgi:hypothetical protein